MVLGVMWDGQKLRTSNLGGLGKLKMSAACGEFAEHVWKPGSCKNCFQPRSAHGQGIAGTPSTRASVVAEEEDGLTFTSPYSKPTIAVRPTMMSTDNSETTVDINMNTEQDKQKSSMDSLGLRKMLDQAPLYIDSTNCRKPLLQNGGIPGKLDYSSRFSPNANSSPGFPKDSMIISSIFITEEDGRDPNNLKENGNSDPFRQQAAKSVKNTYMSNGGESLHCNHANSPAQRNLSSGSCNSYGEAVNLGSSGQEMQAPLGIAINVITAVPGNGVNSAAQEPSSTSPSPAMTPDSNHASLSDSCSYCSSVDSLTGPDVFAPTSGPESPRNPSNTAGSDNGHVRRSNTEPIYAESTKRKQRMQCDGKPQQRSKLDVAVNSGSEGQKATITVMAAHTEENNRTFYLSSPDSAVSTEWPHFSPTTNPAFSWPSTPVSMEITSPAPSQSPKPQSSPPIPPKRSTRSPKLGTSSLSPVPLPELSIHTSLSPRETTIKCSQVDVHTSGTSASHLERRHKLHSTGWSMEGRIEEEEEGERDSEERIPQEGGSQNGSQGPINGSAVWRRSKDRSSGTQGESNATPGTTNNGASQNQRGIHAEEGRQSNSMLASATNPVPVAHATEIPATRIASRDPIPPPPPPKKHHRVCGKMSQSNVELDRLSQQGSVENLTQSLRGLSNFTTTSSDSLHSEPGPQDSALHSCPSPFPSSPLTPSPGSPQPDPFPSNSLGRQLQPPPLPEKKMVNRTVSAPGEVVVRGRPRLPFSGSEGNVCRPDSIPQTPSSPVEARPCYSSNDSLERCQPPFNRTIRSRTLEEPQVKGTGRLGGHSRGSLTSCSSPQLSAPSSGLVPTPVSGTGSTLQLQTLLSNIDSREGIYSKLGGLYAESLRRLALKCEDHFTRSQKNPLQFDESSWSLFKLTCNKPTCLSGDAVYYSASCASDTNNMYAVKICKSQTPDAKQAHLYGLSVQQSIPPHFNIQQDCGHFIACVPQSMLPNEEPSAGAPGSSGGPAPPAQGEQERVVVITREVPHQSAADFVKEWASFHQAHPEVYERRVCFLLLQLCNGLEHLKSHGVTHRNLCLENLLLVPHRRSPLNTDDTQQQHLPRLLISNFAKAKQRGDQDTSSANADPRLKRDHARLAPEIVSAAQYRKFDEFQAGILIYELLHQPNPFEVSPALKEQDYRSEDLPAIPAVSLYSSGLQRLARLLLQPDPIKRIHIHDAKRALHCLLWGPRKDLMEQQWGSGRVGGPEGLRHEGLLNWLDVKRALLMMKFAERSLEPERNAELEDWLCCQYFSMAHPLSLCHTAELLYSLKTTTH
ncbi:inactive tyrosine-protein kinase PRAG1 [Chanos chanos]|uniref:Inactive tyrosine-protein kinase PRAG1 n=1 Tax=Chanos chanos TaxID=29144 RepID=A0A6J2UUR3_CHACN|nr:inactive tyrosine-protein kinase PRAG1 [Chanos chanos]